MFSQLSCDSNVRVRAQWFQIDFGIQDREFQVLLNDPVVRAVRADQGSEMTPRSNILFSFKGKIIDAEPPLRITYEVPESATESEQVHTTVRASRPHDYNFAFQVLILDNTAGNGAQTDDWSDALQTISLGPEVLESGPVYIATITDDTRNEGAETAFQLDRKKAWLREADNDPGGSVVHYHHEGGPVIRDNVEVDARHDGSTL